MNKKTKEDFTTIMIYAMEEAIRTGCKELKVEHIVIGAFRQEDNSIYRFMIDNDLPIEYIKNKLDEYLDTGKYLSEEEKNSIQPDENLQKIISIIPDTEHIRAIMIIKYALRFKDLYFTQLMASFNIDFDNFSEKEKKHCFSDYINGRNEEEDDVQEKYPNEIPESAPQIEESVISQYGVDLTEEARQNRLDPVIGRSKEILRVMEILGRRKKNNALLIGEAGVGKSSIAEAIASKIADKKVPLQLMDKKIISMDIAALVAGTKFRGEFEERIKRMMNEVKNDPDIILFIDEIHTIVGAGNSHGSLDASEMLKPALARGEFQCIGTTTLDEYRNIIEKDAALSRRFQKVMIEPTTKEETFEILSNIKKEYETFHHVKYTDEALHACINLSVRYITDRNLPDKAIDMMDEAGARKHLTNSKTPDSIVELHKKLTTLKSQKENAARNGDLEKTSNLRDREKEISLELNQEKEDFKKKHLQKIKKVTEQDICRIISDSMMIPIDRIAINEGNKLLSMSKVLSGEVIGQDKAIEELCKAIKRNRAGLNDPNRPIGSFLFVGPSGVGKTYLAKKLAEFLFDNEDRLIRIDMSEYMEKHSVSRLIGAPPGYVGYEKGGELSEKVRNKPYSVVLLDEVEKVHPDIFNILLQVLDEGRLTDSNGRFINFKNTVLILTSNIGNREIMDFGQGIGFNSKDSEESDKRNKNILDKAIKKFFSLEFINRLDAIIQFKNLDKNDLQKIVKIEFKNLEDRLKKLGYKMKAKPGIIEYIAESSFNSEFGARPIKRMIEQNIESKISDIILAGLPAGSIITIDFDKKKKNIEVTHTMPEKAKK